MNEYWLYATDVNGDSFIPRRVLAKTVYEAAESIDSLISSEAVSLVIRGPEGSVELSLERGFRFW